jgi:sugar lactone lactonase YvrE
MNANRRHSQGRNARTALAAAGALALLVAAGGPAQAADHVIAGGLVSPLGFAVGADGTLYVAEAFAGKLTAVTPKGKRSTLVKGPEGQFTSGVDATGKGTVSYTLSMPPEFQDGPPSDTTMNRVLPNGRTLRETSLLAYERSANPDAGNEYGLIGASSQCLEQYAVIADGIGLPAVYHGAIDSNPYAVAIDTDGSRVVADAAGNSVVRVSPNGRSVSTVGVLPPIPQTLTAEALEGLPLDACVGATYSSNPVPTDVEIGPDGDYYVSALPGFPESPGAGRVFKISRTTGEVSDVAGGFTGAVDLAVAADGTIYVAELFAFQVSRVDPGATSASGSVFVPCPTAVEIGPGGTVLAAEGGICQDGPPQEGRIIRISV